MMSSSRDGSWCQRSVPGGKWRRGKKRRILIFLGASSLSRLCMPDRVFVFQWVSRILKKPYLIRPSEGACSTTAFASEPPGAGVSQKQFALELLYIYRKYWLPVLFYDMLNPWVFF